MKVKLDPTMIDVCGQLAQFGLQIEFNETLLQMTMRSSLQSLILKLAKAKTRIRKGAPLHIAPAEALCFHWTMELYNEDRPNAPEYYLCKEYFINSLTT